MLEGRVESFRYEISKLKETVFQMNSDPYKYGISEKEADKRRSKFNKYEEKLKIIESQMQLAVGGGGIGTINNLSSNTLGTDNDLEENLMGEDGEYTNTRNKDNKQVLTTQKEMLRGQDKHFDKLSGIAHNLKEEARQGGVEIDNQNNMLDDLNTGIDRTNIKMMRVDSKLKKLIAESSQ